MLIKVNLVATLVHYSGYRLLVTDPDHPNVFEHFKHR